MLQLSQNSFSMIFYAVPEWPGKVEDIMTNWLVVMEEYYFMRQGTFKDVAQQIVLVFI